MAHPWPACMHIIDAKGMVAAKSASSSTRLTDLPPSSRNTRLSVGAPFSTMRFPVAVEPVKEMRSTRGPTTSTSPTTASDDVTTLTLLDGEPVYYAYNR